MMNVGEMTARAAARGEVEVDPVKVAGKMLEMLADMHDQEALIEVRYREAVAALMPPELQAALDALESEKVETLVDLRGRIVLAEMAVKQTCIELGETVKGTGYMVQFNKPRVTWNGKALSGYAAAHPEIEHFKKVGKPTASIKKVRR